MFSLIDRAFPPVAVANFNFEDWGVMAGVTAVCFPLGYLAGERLSALMLVAAAPPAAPLIRCHRQ